MSITTDEVHDFKKAKKLIDDMSKKTRLTRHI